MSEVGSPVGLGAGNGTVVPGGSGTVSPRVRITSSRRVTSRWAASFSVSISEGMAGEQVGARVVRVLERDAREAHDRG